MAANYASGRERNTKQACPRHRRREREGEREVERGKESDSFDASAQRYRRLPPSPLESFPPRPSSSLSRLLAYYCAPHTRTIDVDFERNDFARSREFSTASRDNTRLNSVSSFYSIGVHASGSLHSTPPLRFRSKYEIFHLES